MVLASMLAKVAARRYLQDHGAGARWEIFLAITYTETWLQATG